MKELLLIFNSFKTYSQASSCLAKPQNFRTNTGIKVSMETVKENLKSIEQQRYLTNYERALEGLRRNYKLEGSGENQNSQFYDDFLQERFLPLTIPPPTDDYVTSRVS